MKLRPYQKAAIDAIWAWWAAGRQGEDPLVCLPTAAGKTVVFSALIRRLMDEYPGVSVLILAHRKELIAQAEAKLKSVWPEAPVGVYAAALDRREIAPVMIASRDTIAPVIDDIGQFTFVIVDECHNVNTRDEGRYRAIIGALRERYPHLVVIGFTATPFRLGQGRVYGPGKPFADLAYRASMRDLIEQGYLSRLTSMTGKAESIINTDGIRTVAGDFDERQLAERATSDALVEAALADWKEKAYDTGRGASVFFCVSVLHAQIVSEKLAKLGITCPWVAGETHDDERDAILSGFDRGDFPAIANVGILTEGWDCPRCDCIALLRPTQSVALYVQMVGRGLRLFPGKQNCLILDYGGNIQRLGPVDQADVPEPVKRKRKSAATPGGHKTCGVWGEVDGEFNWRNGCGEKNHPAARECVQCGRPFISHGTKALEGGVISSEQRIEWFSVEQMTARVAMSNKTGRPYLRIGYQVSLLEVFYDNLMLGYPGSGGYYAAGKWRDMVEAGSPEPASPQDAERLLTAGEATFKPVARIAVDMASRWKDIVRIEYAIDTQRHAA